MTTQFSVRVRNARADAFESTVGASPTLRLYSGGQPANCAASATGTLLCEMALPADWMTAASGGQKTLLGTWQGVGATAAGAGTTAGYFRIVDATDTYCDMQGSVTGAGGGGDMTLDNVSIASTQVVAVLTFTLTEGNA